jgi:hypothetical protein
MSTKTNAPSLQKCDRFLPVLPSKEFARYKAASPRAVKYSIALEKGPCDINPSAAAEDNLSMMGSPVFVMAEMDPICGYDKVASDVWIIVH